MRTFIYIIVAVLLFGCVPEHNPKLDASTKFETILYGTEQCRGAVFYSNLAPECNQNNCAIGPAFRVSGIFFSTSVVKKETWPASCQSSIDETKYTMTDQEGGCSSGGNFLCFWDQDQIDQFKKLDKNQ